MFSFVTKIFYRLKTGSNARTDAIESLVRTSGGICGRTFSELSDARIGDVGEYSLDDSLVVCSQAVRLFDILAAESTI